MITFAGFLIKTKLWILDFQYGFDAKRVSKIKRLVIIPAFNEEKNIKLVLEELRAYVPNMDLLVINDCSTDNTRKVLIDMGATFIDLPCNLGIGGAVQTGYCYALEHNYDIAVQFDGDGQHMAEYINSLILPIESNEADVVIGSRFIEKEGFQSSALRRVGIGFLSKLIRLLTGIKVWDVTSGMRAVNRKMIDFYTKNYAQDFPEPEALLLAGLKGSAVSEVPVKMRERLNGSSSIRSFTSAYYMVKVSLALILSWIFLRRKDDLN